MLSAMDKRKTGSKEWSSAAEKKSNERESTGQMRFKKTVRRPCLRKQGTRGKKSQITLPVRLAGDAPELAI